METSLVLRAARAAVFAAVCVLLAVFGHALDSQSALPAVTVAEAWCALCALACCATGRERGFPAIAGFMLATQVLLHPWFQAAQIARPAARCVAVVDLPSGLSVPALCGGAAPGWALNATVLAAYLLAALACAWWLRRGEAAVFAVTRLVLALGHSLLGALTIVEGIAPPPTARRARRRNRDWDGPRALAAGACLAVVRRGPPAAHATA